MPAGIKVLFQEQFLWVISQDRDKQSIWLFCLKDRFLLCYVMRFWTQCIDMIYIIISITEILYEKMYQKPTVEQLQNNSTITDI